MEVTGRPGRGKGDVQMEIVLVLPVVSSLGHKSSLNWEKGRTLLGIIVKL